MALMYRKVLSVITQPPSSRPDSMIEQLIPWFQKKSKLFGSLQQDVMKDIIRNCEFMTCYKDHVIIRQFDTGDRFYNILGGQVSIYVNNKTEDDEASGVSTKKDYGKIATNDLPGYRSIDRNKYGIFVTTLGEGESFGEVALITEDCVRTASVIADTKTDLLVVSRELFNRCLRAAQEQEFNARMTFVNSCEYFCNWRPKYKKQVAMSLIRRKAAFDEKIVKQGSPVEGIFFVIRGEVKIMMDPSAHWHQNSAVWQADSSFWNYVMRPDIRSKICGTDPTRAEELGRSRKDVEVCIVAPLQAIGDVEISLDIPTYLQTATATEPCDLLLFNRRAYDRLVLKKYSKTGEILRTQSKHKIERRLERFSENDSSYFLRCLWLKLHSENQKPSSGRYTTSENCLSFTNTQKDSGAKSWCTPSLTTKAKVAPWRTFSAAKRQTSLGATWPTPNHKKNVGDGSASGLVSICEITDHRRKNEAKDTRRNSMKQTDISASLLPIERITEEAMNNVDVGANLKTPPLRNGGLTRSATASGLSDLDRMTHASRFQEGQTKSKEPFKDWETSDEALSILEMKLKTWHNELESKDRKPKRVFRLRRLSIDSNTAPLPGQRVMLTRRRHKSDMDWTLGSDEEDNRTLTNSESSADSLDDFRYKPQRSLSTPEASLSKWEQYS